MLLIPTAPNLLNLIVLVLEKIECDSGRCVGNNADMGAWNSGHCSWDEGSRRGGETCSKNAECESNICMGNGGGLLTVFGTENAGQCAHVDGKALCCFPTPQQRPSWFNFFSFFVFSF